MLLPNVCYQRNYQTFAVKYTLFITQKQQVATVAKSFLPTDCVFAVCNFVCVFFFFFFFLPHRINAYLSSFNLCPTKKHQKSYYNFAWEFSQHSNNLVREQIPNSRAKIRELLNCGKRQEEEISDGDLVTDNSA